jgi:hypothetical protein
MAGGRLLGLCRLEDGWMQPERLLTGPDGKLEGED